jgi:hypothetical protein
MSKICGLVDSVDAATDIVNEVRSLGIEDKDIHVLSNDSIQLEDLPEPDMLEESDFVAATARGASVGGLAGMCMGLMAVVFPPAGITLGGGAVLVGALGGASFGSWASAVIGVSVPNSRLREFEDAIEQGNILILIDASDELDDKISQIFQKHLLNVISFGEQSGPPPMI